MVINDYGNLPSPVRPIAGRGNLSVPTETAGMVGTGLVAKRSSQAVDLNAYAMFTCRQCKICPYKSFERGICRDLAPGTKLALLYFLAGFTIGALALINKAAPLYPAIWGWLPLHIEFLLMGWILQLVFAVGYWIFPRFKVEPKRGNPALAWASLVLLNTGIVLASASGFSGGLPGCLSAA